MPFGGDGGWATLGFGALLGWTPPISVGHKITIAGDNDKNTILDYNLKPIPCRFLTTTTHWFIAGSRFKNDFIFFEREGVKTAMEDDFDRMGTKIRSHQRFAVGVRDFLWIQGNPGA
jgi:hypothetical protein